MLLRQRALCSVAALLLVADFANGQPTPTPFGSKGAGAIAYGSGLDQFGNGLPSAETKSDSDLEIGFDNATANAPQVTSYHPGSKLVDFRVTYATKTTEARSASGIRNSGGQEIWAMKSYAMSECDANLAIQRANAVANASISGVGMGYTMNNPLAEALVAGIIAAKGGRLFASYRFTGTLSATKRSGGAGDFRDSIAEAGYSLSIDQAINYKVNGNGNSQPPSKFLKATASTPNQSSSQLLNDVIVAEISPIITPGYASWTVNGSAYAFVESVDGVATADISNTFMLESILFADGTTPESQGLQFWSSLGFDSPNIVPEPSSLVLMVLCAALIKNRKVPRRHQAPESKRI
jgi:hypothetical protein